MSEKRVLVVGTTIDYIEIIDRLYPGRALFVTDTGERGKSKEPPPDPATELLTDLTVFERVISDLKNHLTRFSLHITGIVSFDCESMALASYVARELKLPYPSTKAIDLSRNKYVSKQVWQKAGVTCPRVELVKSASEAVQFMKKIKAPVVLKPLTGSGSELVFICRQPVDCERAFETAQKKLSEHHNLRMYGEGRAEDGSVLNVRRVMAVEEFIPGVEYSSDFVIDGDHLDIIRIAEKIPHPGQPDGTILAYILPAVLPEGLNTEKLHLQLLKAARGLGLERAMCMVDFIIKDGKIYILELTPRPGGDCLPDLILKSCGWDILGAALDFSERKKLRIPEPAEWKHLVGVRLFAEKAGTVGKIDSQALHLDRRVVRCYLKWGKGHRVVLPPEDYDSRILGHVIFRPRSWDNLVNECLILSGRLKVTLEPRVWSTQAV
nr:ATP-grasp domain-containing protein [candidate division Zixibacteria bacterium]